MVFLPGLELGGHYELSLYEKSSMKILQNMSVCFIVQKITAYESGTT